MGNELNAQAAAGKPQMEYQGHSSITSTASGPRSEDQPPEPLRKKKSGTFWPRKLSLSLQRETDASKQHEHAQNATSASPVEDYIHSVIDEPEVMSDDDSYVPVERPRSPPPKLPELDLEAGVGQGSFMDSGAEDLLGILGGTDGQGICLMGS